MASSSAIHIWKYTSGHYIPWRKFPSPTCESPCFSPTLSSILGWDHNALQVWRLDGLPIVTHHSSFGLHAIPSSCGTYVVTGHLGGSNITITNLLSQNTPHLIDTGMRVNTFTLTGNVLLVEDSKKIAAWRLTEEGVVDGISGNRSAGRRDRIWTIPQLPILEFVVEDQTVTIQDGVKEECIYIYHMGTGEALTTTKVPPWNPHYWISSRMAHGQHYPHYYRLDGHGTCPEDNWPVSLNMFRSGWVKDPEGKHRLWVPAAWRKSGSKGGWLCNSTTLNLDGRIIVKF